MQINIKLKFDKNNKPVGWQRNSRPFFIDNQPVKNKDNSPNQKALYSFRESRERLIFDEKETYHTHREPSKDMNNASVKRPSTGKKSSKGKNNRGITTFSSEKKYNQLKKNTSDKLKKTKKKMVGADSSNFMDEEGLRSSLPGLSGKKVLQRFAPMLSENQKI